MNRSLNLSFAILLLATVFTFIAMPSTVFGQVDDPVTPVVQTEDDGFDWGLLGLLGLLGLAGLAGRKRHDHDRHDHLHRETTSTGTTGTARTPGTTGDRATTTTRH